MVRDAKGWANSQPGLSPLIGSRQACITSPRSCRLPTCESRGRYLFHHTTTAGRKVTWVEMHVAWADSFQLLPRSVIVPLVPLRPVQQAAGMQMHNDPPYMAHSHSGSCNGGLERGRGTGKEGPWSLIPASYPFSVLPAIHNTARCSMKCGDKSYPSVGHILRGR